LKASLQRHIIAELAIALFMEKGYENVQLNDIAKAGDIEEQDVYKYFGSKQDIILFFYQRINADWELFVNDLNERQLSERFEKALLKKIELIAPYTGLLSDIMGLLMKSSSLGVNSHRTWHIRMKGMRIMQEIVEGSNSKTLKKKIKDLPAMLYIMHWAVLFFSIQSNDQEKVKKTAEFFCSAIQKADGSLFYILSPFLKDLTQWSGLLLDKKAEEIDQTSRQIMNAVFNHRKVSSYDENCIKINCEQCIARHSSKVEYYVLRNEPVHFILPAFPAKSPNQLKVLGELPDLAEETALITLESICKEIMDVYRPGARITICSDGRIFADLVGVSDEKVTNYTQHLKKLIQELQLNYIDIVNLEDLVPAKSFEEARMDVISAYAEPVVNLAEKLKGDKKFQQLFNGIHRFIIEDRLVMEPGKSKTRIKEDSKHIALDVIMRSNAWTRFLSVFFPEAVRLSIHPYSSHSNKIGIQITNAVDNWLTPWHGTMVLTKDGYTLMKKQDAEKLNAKLILKNNRPYYYSVTSLND
jgi:pyoverdine/dityrosine biosynthesis protein Dit1/AcrR family transcriptional regulator